MQAFVTVSQRVTMTERQTTGHVCGEQRTLQDPIEHRDPRRHCRTLFIIERRQGDSGGDAYVLVARLNHNYVRARGELIGHL